MTRLDTPSRIGRLSSKLSSFRTSKKKINRNLRIRSYKVSPSQSISISSGGVILSIGLIIGISIPAIRFESTLGFSDYSIETPFPYSALMILLLQITIGILINYEEIIGFLILGWFIGGIFASLIYSEEGKKGPYYSAIIAISVTSSLSVLFGIISLSLNDGIFTFDQFFLPMIAMILLSLLLSVISIPLIIIALLGYRVGGYISND